MAISFLPDEQHVMDLAYAAHKKEAHSWAPVDNKYADDTTMASLNVADYIDCTVMLFQAMAKLTDRGVAAMEAQDAG
jgi:hypothetical protein